MKPAGGTKVEPTETSRSEMTDCNDNALAPGDHVEIVSDDLIIAKGTRGIVNSIQHTADGSPFAIVQDAMGEDYDWVHVCSDPEEIRKVDTSTNQQVNTSTLAEDGA